MHAGSVTVLLVARRRYSEDADILADLVHLKEQQGKVVPKTALEYVRHAVWEILYADDAFVSQSPHGVGLMMAIIFEVSGAFSLTFSENKTEIMHMPIPHKPATPITLNAAGQQYRQTASFVNLGGAVTEIPNL